MQNTQPAAPRAATIRGSRQSTALQPRRTEARPVMEKAEQGRVNYFAFGGNVNKAVVQRRGLKPRRSITGTVHNHKLYFAHVGGALLRCALLWSTLQVTRASAQVSLSVAQQRLAVLDRPSRHMSDALVLCLVLDS